MNSFIQLLSSLFLLLSAGLVFGSPSTEEARLLTACSRREARSCEKLGAYYIERQDWKKAQYVGEALCTKDEVIGCTYAGMAYLAQGKAKEGNVYLVKSCDKFEPFACRSLGRLMKKSGEGNLSHLYFRRACHYGLREICLDLQKKRNLFSPKSLEFIKELRRDCVDTQYSSCKEKLNQLNVCDKRLPKEDCILIPGYLSIYFRARLMQAEAKLLLTSLLASEKKQKNFSHDLEFIFKDFTPADSYHYAVGFMKSCATKSKSNTMELYPKSYASLNSLTKEIVKKYYSKGKKQDCYDPQVAFEAFAVGNLDPLHPEKLDVWKINQDGNIIQVQDGLPD